MISGFVLIVDQLTKLAVAAALLPGESRPALPPLLQFTYVQNTGAAFGLLKGRQAVFIIISLLVIGGVAWELAKNRSMARLTRGACALILGGAAGNLVDRLRFGYVVDFLDFRVWPVFNVADSCITIGVVLLIWQSLCRVSD